MRKIAALSLGGLMTVSLALSGCAAMEKTGEVGNKNLRPYTANDHEKHGLPLNGVHSYGSPTYRLRSADDRYDHQDEWMLRNRMGNNLIGAHGNDQLEMDEGLARRLEALPGVNRAYVLLAGERAYVGIGESRSSGQRREPNEAGMPAARMNKIVQTVKSHSSNTHTVYVTSHPEYLSRMEIYREAEKKGRPVREYLAEFNALAARIFPAVTNSGPSGTAIR